MTDLRLELLAHAVALLSPKALSDDINTVVEHLHATIETLPDRDEVVAATARDISAGRLAGQRCRAMVLVEDVSPPRRFFDSTVSPKARREYVEVTLTDVRGEQLPTLPVVAGVSANALLAAYRSGAPVLVNGVGIEIPELSPTAREWGLHGARQAGYLVIEEVSEQYTHLDAIAATPDERRKAEQQLTLAKGNVRALLTEVILKNLDIVRGSYLDRLVQLVVVQAMGAGMLGSTPGTIHIFIVGPPGHGKKLLALVAAILNPSFVEVMPGRATVPGLTGTARGKGTIGALSRASGGVTSIQDAHAFSATEVKQLAPVLQHAIEDGEIRIGGMLGGQTRSARTSLLIDTNRGVALDGRGSCPPIMDQLPLFTRFDIVSEIELDSTTSWEVGAQILSTGTTAANVSSDWERSLQVIVASLRDRHATVDIREAESALTNGYADLAREFSDFFSNHQLIASSVARRLAVSLKKLTCAAARSEGRSKAEPADAELALECARQKLTFIRNHVVQLSSCPAAAPDPGSWLRSRSGIVNPQELANEYEQTTGHKISERTFRRHLIALGAKQAGKGLYRIEGPAGGELVSTVGSFAIARSAEQNENKTQDSADLPVGTKSFSNHLEEGRAP